MLPKAYTELYSIRIPYLIFHHVSITFQFEQRSGVRQNIWTSIAVNLTFSLTLQFDPEKLKKLRPVFKEDGTITAGNSSTLSDGAAVLLLTSAAFADEHKLKILGRIRGFGDAAQVLHFGYHPMCTPVIVHTLFELFNVEPSCWFSSIMR